ncbi:CRYAB [Lepeophtheirus salmonis]|uniref:CRYAB n=2 Tax=Lepeophtheirus salmonis TaxID=72036 RepID=A0A7R8CW27_LEPSM|nr:CRYAB [Lepeophtheirus salmonis]CAF2949833.1 CRYAB [Lepeophtheirus salmonis]
MMSDSSFMFNRLCREIPFHHGFFHTNSLYYDPSLFSKHPYFNFHIGPSNSSWSTYEFIRHENMFKRHQQLIDQNERLISLKNDDDKFEISLNTYNFKPEDIQVNIKDKVLSIQARQEEKKDNESKGIVAREFMKRYTLPKNVKVDTLHSNLSADGVLVICAEKTKVPPGEDGERNIPISYES